MDFNKDKNSEIELNKPDLSNKIKKTSNEGIFMSVSKKSEKITTAMYMVTDLIPQNDPIRQKLRDLSVRTLSETRALSYAITGDIYFHLSRIISMSWEMVSLMEVSVVVGFISDMNYGYLKNALIDFISDLRNRQRIESFKNIEDMKFGEGEAASIVLKSDFFKVTENDLKRTKEETSIPKQEEALIIKDKTENDYKGQNKMSFIKKTIIKDKSSILSPKIKDRKQKILSLILEKKDISINDIISSFPEYSQKTIQRDLISLTQESKIKKVGDKRWSRYQSI